MKTEYKRALTFLLLILITVMLSSAGKSPYYTKTVTIAKVYPHKLGYKVVYMANTPVYREIYLPNTLFEQQEVEGRERSRLFTGYDKSYPFMTIFWKDGEFSHVKLYLKEGFNDITWGSLSNPDSYDENFKNAELKFDF